MLKSVLLRLAPEEHANLCKFAEKFGVTPTRAATLSVVRALQESRIGGMALVLDNSHAVLNKALPAIAEKLRSGDLAADQAADLLDAAYRILTADFREMLDARAHMIGFRNDNSERASIDWDSGRTGAQTVLDALNRDDAIEAQEARIAALVAELDKVDE